MKLPVFRSLSDPKLPGDFIAGLTVWAVLVPEALAYASIAGVSPVVGLYAAPGALILYAAFGSSRRQESERWLVAAETTSHPEPPPRGSRSTSL